MEDRILYKDKTNTTNTRSVMKEAKQAPTAEKAKKKLSTPKVKEEVKKDKMEEEDKKKGETKQNLWGVEQVNRAIEAVKDEQLKDLLQKMQGLTNIPTKEAKFINFVVISSKIRIRQRGKIRELCSQAWAAIAEEAAKIRKEEEEGKKQPLQQPKQTPVPTAEKAEKKPSIPKVRRRVKKDKKKEEAKKKPVPSTPSGLSILSPSFSGWATLSSPFPPHSIAIFDTCALLHTKDLLEIAIKNNVIAVVPRTVLYELGKHASTRSEKRLQLEANRVLHSIDMLEKDPLFFMENTKNSRKEKMSGIDVSIPDDNILKCALTVHQHMSDQKRTIWFVTNDKELQLKATKCGASFIVIESQKFMDDMKMKMEMVMVTKKKRSEKMMEAGDLEKLRVCLTQPKQPPESRAEKADVKPSTLTPIEKEEEDKKKQSQQQSDCKPEQAEEKPSAPKDTKKAKKDKKKEEAKKKHPKQEPTRTAEKADVKLSTRVLKREEKRAKKKNSQLQFGIFVVDTSQCSQPTPIRESSKEMEYVPTAKKPLKPMGAYMGKKKVDPMNYELYEDDDDDSDESQLSEIWRDQRSAFNYYILL